jgi:hypothetical protein
VWYGVREREGRSRKVGVGRVLREGGRVWSKGGREGEKGGGYGVREG